MSKKKIHEKSLEEVNLRGFRLILVARRELPIFGICLCISVGWHFACEIFCEISHAFSGTSAAILRAKQFAC